MIDIYMNGAEVHAETPEEEREASLILNAALSGKTTPAGGCICPDQRDSTVGKGITMRFCDGTDMTITPTSDAEGDPELEIICMDRGKGLGNRPFARVHPMSYRPNVHKSRGE